MMHEAVIREARSWIGTPYHHQANIKGVGVDCGMLPIEVYAACELIDWFDPRPYERQFHLHRDAEWYQAYCLMKLTPVPEPLPGDMALFKVGRIFSHGAIVTRWPTVVHAMAKERVTLEEDISKKPLFTSPVCFFTPWGITS